MHVDRFSFSDLERQLESIELDIDKIDYISNEILRCKNAMRDVRLEAKNFEPNEIKISAKTSSEQTSLIELINSDKRIKRAVAMEALNICTTRTIEAYTDFLERAENLLVHYKTKLEARATWIDCSISEKMIEYGDNFREGIVWRFGKEKLIELFENLYRNEMIPKYAKEEILIHFTDEKRVPFVRENKQASKLIWYDSDSAFAVFVDELAKRGAIDDENKFKVIAKHFVNKKGSMFRDLPQKKNYTENFTQTGNLIRSLLDEIRFNG